MALGDDLDARVEDRAAAAWPTIRDGLRRDIGARSFDQWLGRTRYDGFCKIDRTITLALPSAFMANWVQKNFADRLNLAWRTALPEVAGVRILADDGDVVQSFSAAPVDDVVAAPVEPGFRFDPRLNFGNFLVGDANRIAHNAARAIAEGGPMRFNPLFIHGPTGQGKTHLLHAMGHGYTARKPHARALCMSAEQGYAGVQGSVAFG